MNKLSRRPSYPSSRLRRVKSSSSRISKWVHCCSIYSGNTLHQSTNGNPADAMLRTFSAHHPLPKPSSINTSPIVSRASPHLHPHHPPAHRSNPPPLDNPNVRPRAPHPTPRPDRRRLSLKTSMEPLDPTPSCTRSTSKRIKTSLTDTLPTPLGQVRPSPDTLRTSHMNMLDMGDS